MPPAPNHQQTPDAQLGGGLTRMINNAALNGSPTGDLAADQFLRDNSTAVLMGVLFDQRVRAETAFIGPYKLRQRLGHFDMKRIRDMNPEDFRRVFVEFPAVHRFSSVMSALTLTFAAKLVNDYAGEALAIWGSAGSPKELDKRILDFPGFGPGKLTKLRPAMSLFGHRLPSAVLYK